MSPAQLSMGRNSAIAQTRGRSAVRVSASASRPNAGQRVAAGSRLENMMQNHGLANVEAIIADRNSVCNVDAVETVGIRALTTAKGIVDYMEKRTASKSGSNNGAAVASHESVVLSVLQNYSGLTQDRLFNMLRNSGRFNENQSTLSFLLNSLVSQGKVENENGTYRFVSGVRSPSPTPSARASSPAPRATPRAASASSNGANNGDGASAGDEATVLAVLSNYSGLTEDRLSTMLRNSKKSLSSGVRSVLSGLVSQGKVQNDNGTFRYVTKGSTPSGARTSSPTPARSSSPARPAARASAAAAGPGDGASAGDEANVLAILSNYSGLTEDRLATLVRNSKKSLSSSLGSILKGLVAQGKVQNDNGTYRYVTKGSTPSGARTVSPTPVRASSSPARPGARSFAPAAGPGDGASAGDETNVLAILSNYSGLTEDRLATLVRNSKKSLGSSLGSILKGLVAQGKVQNDNGTYRYVTKGSTPSGARTVSPTPVRASSSPARPGARSFAPAAGPGDGASAGDETNVLAILSNYSGLTEDRLATLVRNSKKSLSSSLSSILNGLVSQGKVQNDRGTYRYVSKGSTPSGARTVSPTPVRASTSPARPASSRPASRTATPSAGGATATDEAVVLSVLKNYSGLTLERLQTLMRSAGKSTQSSVSSVLSDLVRSRRVTSDSRTGIYRFEK